MSARRQPGIPAGRSAGSSTRRTSSSGSRKPWTWRSRKASRGGWKAYAASSCEEMTLGRGRRVGKTILSSLILNCVFVLPQAGAARRKLECPLAAPSAVPARSAFRNALNKDRAGIDPRGLARKSEELGYHTFWCAGTHHLKGVGLLQHTVQVAARAQLVPQ